ncbi:hypothetical protein OIO90_006236 [Microbotryomycetes sp. JL221]|nr:hypothetical protein OIO90_006236 [Microbotryomycetes sp. JL221]
MLQGVQVSSSTPSPSETRIVIVYLQGNAGTPLLRLPLFRRLVTLPLKLKTKNDSKRQINHSSNVQPNVTVLAVAPRSYWTSTRATPTESGVLSDWEATLNLGGAAALKLTNESAKRELPPVDGLIVENPLPSIPFMVSALYPQRWLPYHYLGRFAFDRWDAIKAVQGSKPSQPSLWIRSGQDEIIPTSSSSQAGDDQVERMYETWASRSDHSTRWLKVPGALHDQAYLTRSWRDGLRDFLVSTARS